ncbi:MAG: tRNA-queuosine alpha-mannosyltransferase domain-containing protein [Pseudomonadales bacterium]
MNILLLSAYDAVSHQYWRRRLVSGFPEWHFRIMTLPPRHFSWRARGNAMTFSDQLTQIAEIDLIIATSVTDLATLKGLSPQLSHKPSLVYFHENQFAFPSRGETNHSLEAQLTSIYTALSADQLVFNSEFNRRTFFEGANSLLKRFPDGVPKGLVSRLSSKSLILPVPLDDALFSSFQLASTRDIVWNHRWEFDKGPERLLAVIQEIIQRVPKGRVHLVGQQFRQIPQAMTAAVALLERNGRLGKVGYLKNQQEYEQLLRQSAFVLSTADQEFQGLSVMEAMALGCTPVVPDQLAYPEYVPAHQRYQDPKGAADCLSKQVAEDPRAWVADFAFKKQASAWRELIEGACSDFRQQ